VSGPIVAGLIWSLWGPPALLVARALLGIATEVYALRVDRRDVPGTPAPPIAEGGADRSRSDDPMATDRASGLVGRFRLRHRRTENSGNSTP